MDTIKAIDSHIHIFSWTDCDDLNHSDYRQFITPFKEIERFGWKEASQNHNYKESVNAFIESRNYEYVNVACIPYISGRDVSQNIMAALLKMENKKVFAHGGIVYLDEPVTLPFKKGFEPHVQLDELMKIGFDGVKLLETHPKAKKVLRTNFTDKEFAPFFKKLEEEQIHILWHVNDPIEYWGKEYLSPEYPDREEVYAEVYEILRRYPKLKITFAHMFYMTTQRERLEKLLDSYPNVWIDITPGPSNFCNMSEDTKYWHEFFVKYSDRIMFGSDFSTRGGGYSIPNVYRFLLTDDEFEIIGKAAKGIALDRDTIDKILYRNFLNRVGNRPREMDTEAFSAYTKKYESLLVNETNRIPMLEDCKKKALI